MGKPGLGPGYQQFLAGMKKQNINIFAASGAFYLFLSLVPLVLLLLALLPYTQIEREALSQFLLLYAPEQLQELLNDIVRQVYLGSFAALSLSALIMLWSAAKMMSSLTWGINEIYQGRRGGGFLRQRLLGIVYTVILIVFILLSFSLSIFGEYLIKLFGRLELALSPGWGKLLSLQSLVFLCYLILYHSLLFTTIPKRKLRFVRQLPGAAFAAVMGLLFTRLFSWAVDRFDLFSAYGSLSIIIITLIWMYYSMYILYLGAYLNTLWPANAPGQGESSSL